MMKTAKLEELAAPALELASTTFVRKLSKPELAGKAEMLEGDPEEISSKLIDILRQKGALKG
jgi:hypothetical protein